MWAYESVRCEGAGRWVYGGEVSHPDLCQREVQGEAERRRLVESEGALFVPLSLAHLCLRLVGRLSTVEAAFWEAVEHQRRPYEVVPMNSVPAEQIKLWAFPVHPAQLTRPSLWFSVDLVQGIIDYLRTLAEVAMREELASAGPALERYQCHLSRVAALKKAYPERRPEDMPQATLDVEAVWLSHMIRTRNYDEVCHLNFGALVDHRLPATTSLIDGKPIQQRREVDLAQAPSYRDAKRDDMGVDLRPNDVTKDQAWFTQFLTGAAHARERLEGKPTTRATSMPPAEIAEIVEWFCERLRKPAQPGSDDSISLVDQMLLGYERMIYLLARYPHRIKQFTPAFLVDLMWHVHQVHPVAYRRDIQRVAGMMFEHRPWPGAAATGGGQLSRQSAIELWMEEFSKDSYNACELTGLFRT